MFNFVCEFYWNLHFYTMTFRFVETKVRLRPLVELTCACSLLPSRLVLQIENATSNLQLLIPTSAKVH